MSYYLILKLWGVTLIGEQLLKEGGAYFKVRQIIHVKFQNFIIFSFQVTVPELLYFFHFFIAFILAPYAFLSSYSYQEVRFITSAILWGPALILVQVPLGLCLLKCGAYLRPGIYYRKYRSLITKSLALLVKFI